MKMIMITATIIMMMGAMALYDDDGDGRHDYEMDDTCGHINTVTFSRNVWNGPDSCIPNGSNSIAGLSITYDDCTK